MRKLILLLLLVPMLASAKQVEGSVKLVTTSGSTGSNAKRIEFVFSSDFTGTVAGVAYNGSTDASQVFVADQPGDTLASIAYVVTTGSIRIVRIQ